MRIFYACIKNIVIVAFPLLIAINCFYFLIALNPSLDFLGINTQILLQKQQLLSRCPNGGTVFFGLASLKRMLEVMPTDNTPQIIKGLGYSFLTANFTFNKAIPNMEQLGDASIINYLKIIYYVVSILFQPLMALGWLVYAVAELVIEIYGCLEVIFNAFGGMFSTSRCNYYPQELFVVLHYLV